MLCNRAVTTVKKTMKLAGSHSHTFSHMRDYRRYAVLEKARCLAVSLYQATKHFPTDERFGLTAQMRRAVISIPSNFAEGMGRKTDKEKARFIRIAIGSANELEIQLQLSADLGYISGERYTTLGKNLEEVRRMLIGLVRVLDSSRSTTHFNRNPE